MKTKKGIRNPIFFDGSVSGTANVCNVWVFVASFVLILSEYISQHLLMTPLKWVYDTNGYNSSSCISKNNNNNSNNSGRDVNPSEIKCG